jgi:hypothetical protein
LTFTPARRRPAYWLPATLCVAARLSGRAPFEQGDVCVSSRAAAVRGPRIPAIIRLELIKDQLDTRDEPKALHNHRGVVIERGDAMLRRARHDLFPPEAFVRLAPLGRRPEPLTLVKRELQVSVAKPHDINAQQFDDRDGTCIGVDDRLALARDRKHLAIALPLAKK